MLDKAPETTNPALLVNQQARQQVQLVTASINEHKQFTTLTNSKQNETDPVLDHLDSKAQNHVIAEILQTFSGGVREGRSGLCTV